MFSINGKLVWMAAMETYYGILDSGWKVPVSTRVLAISVDPKATGKEVGQPGSIYTKS